MKNNFIKFIKKPSQYSLEIEKINPSFFIWIIAISIFVKLTFDILSPHDFPKEFSYETAGIFSPTVSEYLISYLLILFINFSIFIPIMLFNIIKDSYFFKFVLVNLTGVLFLSIPLLLKDYHIYFAITTPIIIWFLISRRNKEKYYTLLKLTISAQIISIISEPFMFLSESAKNEILFTSTNLFFAILYVIYFVKLIKSKFDISINKIVFYSLTSAVFSLIYGFIIYRSNIFSSNIIK
ncbi:MAG TPA: hypothetical protein PK103_08110 [Elusimicrobiales bacterium]|nr:hypothetical protein [Elusimicrobiales bacterium]